MRWILNLAVGLLVGFPIDAQTTAGGESSVAEDAYTHLSLRFEPNLGQSDAPVRFLSRGKGYTLFLAPQEAVLSLQRPPSDGTEMSGGDVLRMRLLHSNQDPDIVGLDALPGKSHYFTGNDPQRWHSDVPHYARVRYREVYPGIDLVYYGTSQRRLEYDFVVAPGTDASSIRLRFEGAESLRLDESVNLLLETAGGEVVQEAPIAYQVINGVRREVESRYVFLGTGPARDVRFRMGPYDRAHSLVIDPVLSYSTYLGGSDNDFGNGIAVDSSGNIHVVGPTVSTDFPIQNALQSTFVGTQDVFVSKLDASGSALVYSTYLETNAICSIERRATHAVISRRARPGPDQTIGPAECIFP